jgi:hypothetical protein
MYIRWFAAAALETAFVVAVPKFVPADASRTPTSATAVVELGVAVIVQLRYGVICCDPTLRLAAAPTCKVIAPETASSPATVRASRREPVMGRSGRGR